MAPTRSWQTARLVIRQFVQQDWAGLCELQTDPVATHFIGGVWTPARTRELLAQIVATYPTTELAWYAVIDRTDGTFIGACWLAPLDALWCRLAESGPHIELGYRYVRRHWGKGYATEAGEAMLHWGFADLGFQEIVSIVNPANVASVHVLQKLGMTRRKTIGGDKTPIDFYTISNQEYSARGAPVQTGSY